MKIYLYSRTRETGGHEIASMRLMKELSGNATIVCFVNSRNITFISKLEKEKIPYETSSIKLIKELVLNKLKKKNILGININGNFFSNIEVLLLHKMIGIKLDSYVPYYLDYKEIDPSDKLKRIKNFIQSFVSKQYNNIITIDSSCYDALKRSGFKRKIYLFTNKINQIHSSNSLNKNFKYDILLIGRIYFKQKGQDKAIRFLENYYQKYKSPLRVAIAGKGVDEKKLLNLISNKMNHYNYLGHVEKIDEVYNESEVVLMPSAFEGVPLVMLECIERRKKILVSNIPVFRRYIDSNYICDFDKELHKLNRVLNSNTSPNKISNYPENNQLDLYFDEYNIR